MQQLSPEWFKARMGRITGSIAGAALGLSPWQKPQDVMRAMVRSAHGAESEFQGNIATQYGQRHEAIAQLEFTKRTGVTVDEVGFLTHEDWLGASPDGLTDDGGILEIKCPFSMRNQVEPAFKTLAEQPHYYAQVQLEMLCADRKHAYFVQYRPAIGDVFAPDYAEPALSVERIEQDQAWLDEYLPQLKAFHALYLSELDSKEHLEPLRIVLDSDEHWKLINHIGELDDAIHNATEARKAALAELVELADGKDALVCGKKLTKVVRKGSISAAKLISKYGVSEEDQEALRGKPSESWRLS